MRSRASRARHCEAGGGPKPRSACWRTSSGGSRSRTRTERSACAASRPSTRPRFRGRATSRCASASRDGAATARGHDRAPGARWSRKTGRSRRPGALCGSGAATAAASQEESHRMRREQELHNGWIGARAAGLEPSLAPGRGPAPAGARSSGSSGKRKGRTARSGGRAAQRGSRAGARAARYRISSGSSSSTSHGVRSRARAAPHGVRPGARAARGREQERVRHEQSLQRTLSTRVVGSRLGSRASARTSRSEFLDPEPRAGTSARRASARRRGPSAAELERELHQRAEQEHVRRAQDESLEQERLARMGDLERDLATRDEELRRLRDERAQLADEMPRALRATRLRARDLHLQEGSTSAGPDACGSVRGDGPPAHGRRTGRRTCSSTSSSRTD